MQQDERSNEMFASHSNMKGIHVYTKGLIIPLNSEKEANGINSLIRVLLFIHHYSFIILVNM